LTNRKHFGFIDLKETRCCGRHAYIHIMALSTKHMKAGACLQMVVLGLCLTGAAEPVMSDENVSPFNDDFENAIGLGGPAATVLGDNAFATKQSGEPPIAGNVGGASVWWIWTPSTSGPATVNTFGSDFDTLLAVYTGDSLIRLTVVAQNDDDAFTLQSSVQFNATTGVLYRIVVDGYASGGTVARGTTRLNIRGAGGITLQSPTNGTTFTVGDPIAITARVLPDFPNEQPSRVDFYHNGNLFASLDDGTLTAVAMNAPSGSNSFHAIARDINGTPVHSGVATVFVQRIGLTMLFPTQHMVFAEGQIQMNAWPFLPNGSITNVEFLVDGIRIAQDATLPFGALWTNVAGGPHRIAAVGWGDNGLTYQSDYIDIGVITTFVAYPSSWKYLDNGSDQGTNWTRLDFNDSAWLAGVAPLGYGDSVGRLPATTISYGPDPAKKYATTYFRQHFSVTNVGAWSRLILSIERDDGAIVYLNGVEVGRFNMPSGSIAHTNFSAGQASDDGGSSFDLLLSPSLLVDGHNLLAVEVHQENEGSSDLWFRMNLRAAPHIIENLGPFVFITAPTNQQHFFAPQSIILSATASDPDDVITQVEYFADGARIGVTTNEPHAIVWSAPAIGPHTLMARASDQFAVTTSNEIAIVVYDLFATPVAAVTGPGNGAVMTGPTNLLITATANAITAITNVQFLADGIPFADQTSSPYAVAWSAPFGTSVLRVVAFDVNGIMGTSPPVTVVITVPTTNVMAPAITGQFPVAGSIVTNLTSITIKFSEHVQNVDSADLLINGMPATGVNGTHSRSNYTFTFPHPVYGPVNVSWASSHGITDYGWPVVLSFNEHAAGSSWSYTLLDRTPPFVLARTPARESTVTNLTQITITFSEPVSGVTPEDLLVNGFAGLDVTGGGTSYTFRVPQLPSGTMNVTWATNNNIFDLAATPNAFNRIAAGAAWSFTLDTRQMLVQSNSAWRFVKGTNEASTPFDIWRYIEFDDSSWSNSSAPFFFGDAYTNASNPGTLLSDMLDNYNSIFLRHDFTVFNRGDITNVIINAQSDDGYIAWINGVEVRRYNAPPGQPTFNANAAASAPEPLNNGAGYVVATLNNAAAALVDGRNVLAIQAFNRAVTNGDFGFNAQLYTFPLDSSTVRPRLLEAIPLPGDVLTLSNITVRFSESVTGVDASDLLINGVPAISVGGTTNTTYTFSFVQPPYGSVLITWKTGHAIQDLDGPPKLFDGSAAGSTFGYTLINPSNPKVLTQMPLASATVTGLTAVLVKFTEQVSGVDAVDLLINDSPALTVSTFDNAAYAFAFTEPPFGPVGIRWATNHGIVDVEAGNRFDSVRFGAQWDYILVDPKPTVTIVQPTNGTYRLEPATVTITAAASDNDGTIAAVTFYEGSRLLGEFTEAPYSIMLSNLLSGRFVFRAIVTDDIGLLGTSAPVVLNVVTSLPATLVRGPYLQIGTPTSGLVRWRTDVVTDGLVQYGTDPLKLTNFAVQLAVTNEHIVQVSGLQPDTKYYYSIGSAGQRLAGTNGSASDFWFHTSPPPGTRKPTRIWVLGDMGTAGNGAPDRQIRTRDAFYDFSATNGGPPDIWLLLGDNAYETGTDEEHQRAVFDMYPNTLRNRFLWPTLGNHETSQSRTASDFPYLHIFSLPGSGEAGGVASGTEKYYSFDYGNIHFVCLDSMTSGQSADTPMANWLREDLAAATAEWTIVFFHHPPYTKGSHDSDREPDLVNIRQNLVPIMESNGVDLVLSGHSHCWERSYLLDGHYGLSHTLTESMKVDRGDGRWDGDGAYSKNVNGRGVVYTVAGSAGQATGGPLDHPAHFASLNELGTMVIDVRENRLEAMFLHASGEIQDRFTLIKPDPRPTAPLHLVAFPADLQSIRLEWVDTGTNELGFSIQRSVDGVTFTEELVVAADTMTALDTGLVQNVTYHYRVRGTNDVGFSELSNIASATPVLAIVPPEAPANVVAVSDDGVRFYRGQMIVSWRDRSLHEGAFQIERSQDGFLFVAVATVGANVTTYLDQGLESASFYVYRVRALNPAGLSGWSNFAADQTHPQSQLVRAGDSVSFHAGIEGGAEVRYQWYLMDTPIPGGSNETLALASVEPSDQGQYTVVITDSKRKYTSNPATLTVVSPPQILTHPEDYVRGLGMSVEFTVAADGTPPLRYRWRKNASPIGVSIPSLMMANVGFADQGGYHVIVENDFGAITSRVAALRVYALPRLASVSDLLAQVRQPVRFTSTVSDSNVPPLNLRFSLGAGAPTNAVVNPITGAFWWTPNRSQAPSTNLIIMNVFDQMNPILSDSVSFNVYVQDYVELSLGSLVMLTGTNGFIPVTFFASLDVTSVQGELHFATQHLASITFEPITSESAAATVAFQPYLSGANFDITALPGRTLVGTNALGGLRIAAHAHTNSAMVPLQLRGVNVTPTEHGVAPTVLTQNGQLHVVGVHPLLEAHLTAQGTRELALFGRPGVYSLQWATNLPNPVWRLRGAVTIAPSNNLVRIVSPGNTPPTNLPAFFRTRQ
jgi:acid phosphatase type 7